MDLLTLQQKITSAISKLLILDSFLLKKALNERTISCRLAKYIGDCFPNFSNWDVDCEYNKDHDNPKRLAFKVENVKTDDIEAKTVYPDIIIHERYVRKNLLIIEIKKDAQPSGINNDSKRIKKFIEQLKYQFGLFINLKTDKDFGVKELRWFGKINNNCNPLIKKTSNQERKTINNLIDKITKITKPYDCLKNETKQKKVKEYERQINKMVYKLYGLTKNEIKTIENNK